MLLTNRARAYVYGGEWVADCPRACGNVEYLFAQTRPGGPRELRAGQFFCSYCRALAEIEWPPDDLMRQIMDVLVLRPVPHNRNWYPHGHDVAVRFRLPHGQSVQDLIDENAEHGVPTGGA